MRKNGTVFLFVAFTALNPKLSIADNLRDMIVPKEFSAFFEKALAEDPSAQKILLQLELNDFEADLTLPSQKYTLSGSAQYGYDLQEGDNSRSFSAGISKAINSTGTELSATFNKNRSDDRDEETTVLSLNQNLWRNYFGSKTRALSRYFEMNANIRKLEVNEKTEEYASELLKAYLSLREAKSKLEFSRVTNDEVQKLHKNIIRKRTRNVASPIDVARSEVQALSQQRKLEESELAFEKLKQEVSNYLGVISDVPNLKEFSDAELIKLEQQIPSTIAFRESEFNASRRVQKIMASKVTLARDNEEIAQDLSRPELNLLAGFRYDNSTRYGTSSDRQELFGGIELEIPLGDSKVQAQQRQARFEKIEIEKNQAIENNKLKTEIEKTLLSIETQFRAIRATKKEWELSKHLVELENDRFQTGRIDLEDFIDARTLSTEKHQQYLSSRVALESLLIDWLQYSDTLLN